MNIKEKLIDKFLNNPVSLNINDIEKLFSSNIFNIRWGKGSHKIITNIETQKFIVIPIHKNDCKDIYKRKLKIFYLNNN